MSICSNPPQLHLVSARDGASLFLRQRSTLQPSGFKVFHKRRHRVKTPKRLAVTNFNSFHLDSIAPGIFGLTSGLAAYLSTRFLENFAGKRSQVSSGDWVLYTSPSPFNRFVLLRCPSISFEGERLDERLVEEERHFVRLDSGTIPVAMGKRGNGGMNVEYQRVCVETEDGGMISLDWPDNLVLEEERGLDTTVVLVAGTPKGSMETEVKSLVCEALRRGLFPVVMNPRGCAGSPLTTPRLFTAADSDDVSTAIQFLSKVRSWTTLVAVGWGYGANMLTKNLAEVGERTPLTAAVCIDNPFDLKEAIASSPNRIALDQKLADGLVDMLRMNKELFKGRMKGYDVEKGLSSKSVHEFEKVISMVAYGFEDIEDFYSASSTQRVIGNLKIPVLFIQNDDGIAPIFSIPRGSIAENPFTSLLLCSSSPRPSFLSSNGVVLSWCNNLTVEWLAAVELALLKGRHPLLKDIDVTINFSPSLALMDGKFSGKIAKLEKLLGQNRRDILSNYSSDNVKDVQRVNDATTSFHLTMGGASEESIEAGNHEFQRMENGAKLESESVNAQPLQGDESDVEERERGEILQTAQVVMNMLDATMPYTLNAEEKKKVLAAVNQGETLVKALQDAVPEDVREKITTAVSGILNTEGTKLKYRGVRNQFKSSKQGKGPLSGAVAQELYSSNQVSSDGTSFESTGTVAGDAENPIDQGLGLPPETSQQSSDSGQIEMRSSHQDDFSSTMKKGSHELGTTDETEEPKQKVQLSSDPVEKISETVVSAPEVNQNTSGINKRGLETNAESGNAGQGKIAGSDNVIDDNNNADQRVETPQQGWKADNIQKSEGKFSMSSDNQNSTSSNNEENVVNKDEGTSEPKGGAPNSLSDQSNVALKNFEENVIPSTRSDALSQIAEGGGGNDNQMTDSKSSQPAVPTEPSPSFSVSQALDALAGIDDSTQAAVNSVFGVLENMISQYEETNSKDVGGQETNGSLPNVEVASEHGNSCNLPSDVRSQQVESTNGYDGNGGIDELNREERKQCRSSGGANPDFSKDALSFKTVENCGRPIRLETSQGLLPKFPIKKRLDLDATTALFLDYYPEEGQWKLLGSSNDIDTTSMNGGICSHSRRKENIIEPAYVIFDAEENQRPNKGYDGVSSDRQDNNTEELVCFVKDIITDSLKVEVDRRLSSFDASKMDIERDIKRVANIVSSAVGCDPANILLHKVKNRKVGWKADKAGTLCGETIVKAMSSAVQGTRYLRRVIPVGVVIGSSFAALRNYFHVSTIHGGNQNNLRADKQTRKDGKKEEGLSVNEKTNYNDSPTELRIEKRVETGQNISSESVMVGAVTAALGASALLAQKQESLKGREISTNTLEPGEKETHEKEPNKLDDEKNHSLVSSIAEKAMSVAAPVVPTTEDGGIDQEKLVVMLADLGQKGGILKLIGKIALLWGGIRSAMSLTNRLIIFLRIAERPLWQRIFGFSGMVLVLWSPVVVPLLPTLVQSWSKRQSSMIAELTCFGGLYVAVLILIMLWGKRIRGYENPLQEYGFDLSSFPAKMFQEFLKGLAGGFVFVLLIQSVNVFIGCASFSCPLNFPSTNAVALLRGYTGLLLLTIRGIITATGVAIVEELLFRSWLPDEIAAEFGYNQGIIMSAVAFSLLQRSLRTVPGVWLLSLALAGARQRSEGRLGIPIGLRTGIIASSYIFQRGQFLIYNPGFPVWLVGTHPLQPLSGAVGLWFALLLAIVLYPLKHLESEKMKKAI